MKKERAQRKQVSYRVLIYDTFYERWEVAETFINENDAKERAKFHAAMCGEAKVDKYTEIYEDIGKFVREDNKVKGAKKR